MANTYNHSELVGLGMVAGFSYDAKFTGSITDVSKYFGKTDQQIAKAGRSVDIKIPARAISKGNGSSDSSFDPQDLYIETKPFALNSYSKAHFTFALEEESLDLDSLKDDVIVPSKEIIVDGKEEEHMQIITQTGNAILCDKTNSSIGADITDLSAARTRLLKLGVPFTGNQVRFLAGSEMQSSIVDNTSNFFNPSETVSVGFLEGKYKKAKGMAWMDSELLPVYSSGTANNGAYASSTGLTPLGTVAAVPTVGATSLSIDNIGTNGTVTKGTSIEIAGVNAVRTSGLRTTTGYRAQFAVKATETTAAGAVVLTLEDKFNDGSVAASASLKNVTALPQIGAVVYIVGEVSTDYAIGVCYHKNAYMTAFCDEAKPKGGVEFSAWSMGGIKGSTKIDWYFNDNSNKIRTDSYSGTAILRPEFAVKIMQKLPN